MELIQQSEVEFDDDAWGEISKEAKDLILQIFQGEQTRLSAKKVLSHAWLQRHLDSVETGGSSSIQINRLKEFQNKSRFRKAILSFLSTRVTDDDVQDEK